MCNLSLDGSKNSGDIDLILVFNIGAKCAIPLNVGIRFNACMPNICILLQVVCTCAINAAINIYCSTDFILFYMCGQHSTCSRFERFIDEYRTNYKTLH